MLLPTLAAWLLCLFPVISAQDIVASQSGHASAMISAVADMTPRLSKGAVITLPFQKRWAELQIRGSSPRVAPAYTAVVEVATEQDVATVVTIANRYNIPFLAVSGTHGWTKTLSNLPYGIQIRMRKLNSTTVSRDGNTAIVQGGVLQYEITRALFTQGKYAVTGLAECVSVPGPLLGGGHSLLQGQYGYSLDNMVSARVVLASGKLVTASATKNSDLFWALRGAGHNFGILTSLTLKVYPIPSTWTVYSMIYTTDKVEALFTLINQFEDGTFTRPAKLALTGVFVKLPAIDGVNPVVAYTIAYEGREADASAYAARFSALNPISTTLTTDVSYVELYTVTGNNLDSQACVRNNNIIGAGVSIPKWDLPGVRKAFTIFGNLTNDARFTNSITLLENYGMQGVQTVDPASTALAIEERQYHVLASPVAWWDGNDKQTTKDATTYVNSIRDALNSGIDASKLNRHCYVNYANGDEKKPQMYGYDDRLARLTKLKKQFDPQNQFGFYNPILS